MRRALPAAALAVVAPAPAEAITVESTAYCLLGTMADGTYTRPGSVASNLHPFGTRLFLTGGPGPDGQRRYVVRDRIGYGSQLDFWTGSCSTAIAWGRRVVSYRVGWPRPRDRWHQVGRAVRAAFEEARRHG